MILALTGTFETVFLLMGTLVVFGMIISEASLFALRIKEPSLPRPYRAKGYPVLPLLVMAIDVALLCAVLWADPVSGVYMVMLVLVCVPFHLWLRRGKKPRRLPASWLAKTPGSRCGKPVITDLTFT